MPRFVSLDGDARHVRAFEHRLSAGLYGNPVPVARCQRHPALYQSRYFDEPAPGGSSLTAAVSEQLAVEAIHAAVYKFLLPHVSKQNGELLERILIHDMSLRTIAKAEGSTVQAASQRLERLRRRFALLDAWWRRFGRRHGSASAKSDVGSPPIST